ncbi:Vacuolar transporter chaperone 4 [Wickerhamomyces ciferrii]|uniref:Vacuolar transporter chaperone complex subunit 4 n=1 Tax=Wickerhamomyces ciferrii (strain ATCC 14091 / BCRC 22168 / CBS 111 / JCM 3599 / NBRC 0793 / NRRL Y-1031 F-60-10) TaxID=1206466 RepID=K0KKV0_WICCF|nr:Vacuolar transporter chaperone 4 [Wickerhamomyces ciferrii]CCH45830.1 Vacuolar transporter chaperone 4 [Wickerhamomyces ciferrii]
MKFGEHLKSSLIRDYNFYYISYDDLKKELKNGLKSNGNNWSTALEENFLSSLEAELDKVYTFQKVKGAEISRRIKDSELNVKEVIDLIDSETPPLEQDFEDLEEELSDVIADVHDLAKFTRLNYTGFQKIIKKHDKQTGWNLKPIFHVRLDAKPFFKENYDSMVVKISTLYDLVRTRGNPVKGDSAAGGGQQNFVRQTTKYWVHPDNITELKLIILKHLPVLVFNTNKEFEKEDSAITSIYYDNKNLDLYYGRLRKDEGAEAHRLRWYGGMSSDTIFVERKTHREDWTGEKSVKARFPLKEKHVNSFMKGEFTVPQAFEKMRKDGKKSIKEIENLEALAMETQYTVLKDKLRPVVRSFYNRTAFQLPGDARVRISLDTELTMVREDDFDGIDRTNGNWRRMDIGVDWPFNQLPPKDVERFPYAVLEVKLQTQLGQEPPEWVRNLISSHLVEAVPKFSKFIHGVATLLPQRIDLIPFWLPQMNVDIRKPMLPNEIGIYRNNNHSNTNTSSGEYMDEEELIGNNTQFGSIEQVDNQLQQANDSNNENAPLLISNGQSQHQQSSLSRSHKLPILQPIIDKFNYWFTDENTYKVSRDTVFESKFAAPAGKKICVPVRVEPKVYFATERTFLSWISIALILSATTTSLLTYGDKVSLAASVGFFITTVLTILYSASIYIWRVINIRSKVVANYDDRYGPTGICVCLALSVFATFLFRVL